MFTDRYLKVPIRVYDKKAKELTGNEDCEETWYKFLPFELSSYRPTYDVDNPEIEIVTITLKNGDETVVYLSPEKFEELLNHRDTISGEK